MTSYNRANTRRYIFMDLYLAKEVPQGVVETSGRVELWLWVGYALRRGATDKQRPNGFRSNVSVSTVGLYPGLIARNRLELGRFAFVANSLTP